jgi:tetratricopeptide (TPR) repeat protein
MTESLIGFMALIGRLKVISRASAMRYQGSPKSVPEIAHELDVDGIVRGSVQVSENDFHVQVALFNGVGGESCWATAYDRPMTDLFRVQGEIAETIAAEIHLKLTAGERRQFRDQGSRSAEAHTAYLRGRYYWNRETPDALQRSFRYLSVAVQRDPDCAAYPSALTDWYLSAGGNGLMPVSEGIAKARAAALRALELDSRLAEAYASLGRVAMDEWDLQRAWAEFETASGLNQNLVEPVIWSARALSYLALHDQAFRRVEIAQQLDPVSPRPYLGAAAIYYIAGEYHRAVEESLKALDFEPRLAPAFYIRGLSELRLGMYAEALKSVESAIDAGQRHPAALAGSAVVLASTGRTRDALNVLEEMRDRATRAEVSPYYFAEVHLALGDIEKALRYLRRSYELHIPDIVGIGVDPLFHSLHGHPEFERILHDVGLPSDWASHTG